MIIDEVDAFPYSGNPFLERLVHKSMNFNALLFVMSATITPELSKLIKTKQIEYFEIFVRYHLRELPVPRLKKSLFFMSDLVLAEIIRLSRDKQKLIVYVSSIKKAQSLSNKLNSLNFKNQIISSKTVYKNEVIKGFEADDFNIIVSTTILERGVTFANLNVLVLEADHSVFSTSTLIQIAGRVGRNEMFGEIIFLSRYKSKAMLEAIDKIKEKNKKYAMQTM
jgi:competence protein ComFA